MLRSSVQFSSAVTYGKSVKNGITCLIAGKNYYRMLLVAIDYCIGNIALIILVTIVEAGNGNVLTLIIYPFVIDPRIDQKGITILGCRDSFRNGSIISRPVLSDLPGNR